MLTRFTPKPERRPGQRYTSGFTLLEVLIALAIFALLSSAIAGQTSLSLRTQETLEAQRIASQLLNNTIEQYQLMSTLAPAGRKTQMVKFADRYWDVEVLIENTRRADMRSIKASVYELNSARRPHSREKERNAAAQITAYLGAN